MIIMAAPKGSRVLVVLVGMAVLIPAGPALAQTAPEPTSTATSMTAQAAPVVMARASEIIVGSTVDIVVTGTPGESVALIWAHPLIEGEVIVHASVLDSTGQRMFTTRPSAVGTTTYLAQTASGRSNRVEVQVLPLPKAPVAVVGPEEINLGDWVTVSITGTPGDIVDLYAYKPPEHHLQRGAQRCARRGRPDRLRPPARRRHAPVCPVRQGTDRPL